MTDQATAAELSGAAMRYEQGAIGYVTGSERVRPGLLFVQTGRQLRLLAGLLGLVRLAPLIARTHDVLCSESTSYPIGQRPPRRSALNADGTPIQLSLTLGTHAPRLALLSDVGAAQLPAAMRIAAGREAAGRLAELFGVGRSFACVEPLVDRMAPARDPALLAEPAGAFWIGAGFARGRRPTLKLYVNARWGEAESRWARLSELASWLGAADAWRAIRRQVGAGLEPLGAALAVAAGSPVAGRIYLAGFGRRWPYLESLGAACGGRAFAAHLGHWARTLLADDYAFPTRSVVCSFGLAQGALADVKVELCAHCAFASDQQAHERCAEWLRDDAAAACVYGRSVALLSGARLSDSETTLHSYLGVSSRCERTLYFNPAAARRLPDESAGQGSSADDP